MSICRTLTRLMLAGTALTALAQSAFAQSWDGSESGDWGEGGNWSTNAAPAENSIVLINDGTVTSQPVLAAGDEFNIRSINVGAVGGAAPVLTVNGMLGIGQGPNGGFLNIASADNNSVGTVLISGAGASIGFSPGATSTVTARVGATSGSNGTLRITNGGTGRFSSLFLADGNAAAAGVGLVEVTGAGSVLEITSGGAGLRIGNFIAGGGVGTLRILDGAAFSTPGGVGTSLGVGSSILVSGMDAAGIGSSFIVPTGLQVRGGSFTVEDGAQAQVTSLTLEGDASLRVLDGGTLSSSGAGIGASANIDSNVSVVVSGAGSRWTSTPTNFTLRIGNGSSGIGSLEVLDGGEVDINSTFVLAEGSTLRVAGTDAAGVGARFAVAGAPNLNGEILVQDGGIASFQTLGLSNTGSLTVTAGGLARIERTSTWNVSQQAEVLISGAGAEIRSNGGLSLINNSAGLPTADFIIEDGARLELSGSIGAGVSFSNGTGERRNLIVRDGSELVIVNQGFGFLGNNGGLIVESGSQVITRGSWDVGQASTISVTDGSLLEFGSTGFSRFSPETTVLISGDGTVFNTNGSLSITSSTQTATAEDFVIADGAVVNVNTSNASSLGFGTERRLIVRDDAKLNMEGGLQLDRGNLLVDNATVNLGTGTLRVGTQFGGNTLTLLNSDFTAGRISNDFRIDNFVNLGGTLSGPAGAVGIFDVGTYSLFAGDTFVLNHTATGYDIATIFQGSNGTIRQLAGGTIFSGNSNQFGGTTLVSGGALQVDGTLGNGEHTMTLSGGARLSGTGTIGGTVTARDATIAAGNSPGTLSIAGDLLLGAASILEFELGAPGSAPGIDGDLINVGGNLTLDGTLNISNLGGFGAGMYRLINYGGSLTDSGLAFGTVPQGFEATGLMLDIGTTGQVNLLATAAEPDFDFIFWDGAATTANGLIDGGTGTWSVTNTNWTTLEANNNGVFDPVDFLIFRAPEQAPSAGVLTTAAATPLASTGLVTVDNSAGQVSIGNGVQFAANGYTVSGGTIALDAPLQQCGECSPTPGNVIVRVGDGSNAGEGFVATISSALTGESGLTKTDLATLILNGPNNYSGGTRIDGGTLQGDTASLQGTFVIAQEAELLFNQPSNGTFTGTLSGHGNSLKQGTGTLTLSGASSTFNGNTRLEEGAINLTGLLGGLLTTLAGTTLSGTGQVASLDLSGTIAPGNSIGALAIDGPATFRPGSIYQVELAADGTGDTLLVDDTASILGGTVAISLLDPEANYTDGTRWTILEAAEGLNGTFDGVTENSGFLDFTLGYTVDSAFLTLALVRQFPDVALTFNQRQASTGLMELDRTVGSDGLAVYNALLMLDGDAARAAFDMASGEIYADVLAAGQRQAQARGAQMLRRGQNLGKPGWEAWMAAGLGRARVKDDGNGARFTQEREALNIGLDYHGPDNAYAAGISGGWQQADLANDARQSSAAMDGFFLGGFLRYGDHEQGFTAAAAISYSELAGSANRNIGFGTISRSADAAIETSTSAYALDLRYGFGDALAIGPSVGIEHGESRLESLQESGAGALNLASAGGASGVTRYGAGAFLSWRQEASRLLFDLRYARRERDDSAIVFLLEGSSEPFRILPARGSKDGVLAAGSGAFDLGNDFFAGADGSAFLAGEESALTLSVWLRYAF